MRISAVVLTKNEEKHLERLLASLSWVDEIIVVDDESTDRTLEIAARYRATVRRNRLTDFSAQRNLGLQAAQGDWVLALDADEEIPEETRDRLQAAVAAAPPEVGGFRLLRRNFTLGKWLQHGQQFAKRVRWYDVVRIFREGHRPGEYLGGAVKLFRRQGARYVRAVHEEVEIPGKILQLQAYVNHYTAESVSELFEKIRIYTGLHAREIYRQNPALPKGTLWKLLWAGPATFCSYFFRKRGFLDGFPGFMRAFASGFYEFLIYAHLYRLRFENQNGEKNQRILK